MCRYSQRTSLNKIIKNNERTSAALGSGSLLELYTTLKWGSRMESAGRREGTSSSSSKGYGNAAQIKRCAQLEVASWVAAAARQLQLHMSDPKNPKPHEANQPNQKSKDVGNMNGNKAHYAVAPPCCPSAVSPLLALIFFSFLLSLFSLFGLSIKARRNKGKLVTWLWGPDDTYKLSTT